GVLDRLDAEGIAIGAEYDGDAEEFVKTLLDLKLLDAQDDGTLALHDWQDHNPYCVGEEDRKANARRAAEIGWQKRRAAMNAALGIPEDAPGIQTASEPQADSMQGACPTVTVPLPPLPPLPSSE